jgi:hypothetical protein
MVERARESKDTHGDLLLETPILAEERAALWGPVTPLPVGWPKLKHA